MADTGAPWNIPYAEPTDIVRDWPALSEDVADAVADALDTRKFGQIVQTVKTDSFSSSSSSFVDVTGATVTITPSSTSSKVLVIVSGVTGAEGDAEVRINLRRGSTNIAQSTGGTRNQTFVNERGPGVGMSIVFLDSPAVDTATTYSLQVAVTSGSGRVGSGRVADTRAVTLMTAIEVSA
jgi:hypothetical protein